MNKVEKKRIKEQETIEKMIHIYCIKNHHTKELCSECDYSQGTAPPIA